MLIIHVIKNKLMKELLDSAGEVGQDHVLEEGVLGLREPLRVGQDVMLCMSSVFSIDFIFDFLEFVT